jgi:Mu-like prophage I protein
MNIRILNREGQLPSDNWYQIEVPGWHFNAPAKLVQLIDAKAVESIVNRFAEEARAENFAGIKIGRDHLSQSLENPTEALGWLHEVRNREGTPEGRIEWTSLGRPLIEGKVYKFFSTEYERPDLEPAGTAKVKNREYPAFRPLRLAGLEVTNDPNNKGGKPISNRDSGESQPDTKMKNLLIQMGLSEDASEAAALAAYNVIVNRATTAEGSLATANTELGTLREAVVDGDLAKYKNRIKPENVEKVRVQLIANRAGTLELLDSMAEPANPAKPITNRAGAKTPATQVEAQDKADKADAEVRAYKITNRCSYEDAHSAVRRLKPELFA